MSARQSADHDLKRILTTLESELRSKHPQARIDAFRYYPETIWIRIIDESFSGKPMTKRDEPVWSLLRQHFDDNQLRQIGLLLTLAPEELCRSAMNEEFEHPHRNRKLQRA